MRMHNCNECIEECKLLNWNTTFKTVLNEVQLAYDANWSTDDIDVLLKNSPNCIQNAILDHIAARARIQAARITGNLKV